MVLVPLILALVLQAPEPKAEKPKHDKPSKPKVLAPAGTPEEAVRSFMVAMLKHDREALASVTVPLPSKDLDVLFLGEKPSPVRAAMGKLLVGQLPMRILKAGEVIDLRRRGIFTVMPEDATADRVMVFAEGNPLPLRCRRVEKRWLVDPSPIIAGRKAAEAARKKKAMPED
jgi:hypothetical protein